MPILGYHASHEQFTPRELVDYVQQAEAAGFQAAMSSDHLAPWGTQQGQSGFAWSWLGAALQATETIPFGSLAIPIGYRYHPVIVAQAAATLAQMFPNRFQWIAAGSGQPLNEQAVNDRWPSKAKRNELLLAGVEIIRALWAGETVTREGPHQVLEAKLWTRPQTPPKIYGAALSTQTARWIGSWADGLITINQPKASLQKIVDAFRAGGGEGKPMALQIHLSWAETEQQAHDNAYAQWRTNIITAPLAERLRTPQQFEAATQTVRPEDMAGHVLISASAQQHVDWIQMYAEMGFEEIFLHNVGRNQRAYIQAFGESVLPAVQP